MVVRYGDGGGVGPDGRMRREQVRQRAAGMFADGMTALRVRAALEISTKSAYAWRRAWLAGDESGLASRGASGPPRRPSDEQLSRLAARLELGPAAAGYVEDQRWTLVRVSGLISTRFHVRLSLPATSAVLRRMGWTPRSRRTARPSRTRRRINCLKCSMSTILRKEMHGIGGERRRTQARVRCSWATVVSGLGRS
jgi:transposase